MFKNSKLFFWTVEILAVTLLIFTLMQLDFLFQPIQTLLALLFIPFIIAGFLYYIFKPVVIFMEKRWKIKRFFAILIVLLSLLGIVIWSVASIIPNVVSQLTSLINASSRAVPELRDWISSLQSDPRFSAFYRQLDVDSIVSNINLSYTDILNKLLQNLTGSLGSIVSIISSVVMVAILVPILLYYMLKDGEKLLPTLKQTIFREDPLGIIELLEKMNATISRYISGVALDSLLVFIFVFVGYMLFGIPYAFLFASFSAITNLIPYAGPYIGVIPVIFTLAFTQPWTALLAVTYVLVLQQIDGNLVYPKIVGNAVKVHPVTVMILMLVSGSLYGILGMIIAVPVYSLVKEIVKFLAGLWHNHREQQKKKIISK
ncbi:MAG TPA: AI-2E family transporter [Lactococcus sp.]|uniref:AI-2E family transporter n=1 Tax=unclassified Lactococcus TaxID=2643510 RepID=UPI000E80C79B|nr:MULTISPECIES: AI-2E family transporter [unclassified Lactococcus]HBC90150.1 AI-2E family transporter [Lactococcus sp.]